MTEAEKTVREATALDSHYILRVQKRLWSKALRGQEGPGGFRGYVFWPLLNGAVCPGLVPGQATRFDPVRTPTMVLTGMLG